MIFIVFSVLVVCLAFLFPILDKLFYKKIDDGSWPKNRVLILGILWSWVLSGIVLVLLRSDGAGWVQIGFASPGLDKVPEILKGMLIGAMIGIVLFPLSPILFGRTENGRALLRKQVQGFKALLPRTPMERWVFAALSVTAGVTEEFLFRGFLFAYFSASPFHLSGFVLVLVGGLIFGAAHIYQGVGGVISTTVMGLCFGWIYLATGSLLIPMAIHTLIDLRFCFIPAGILEDEADEKA